MLTHSSPYSSKTRSNSVLPSLSAASKACQQLVSSLHTAPRRGRIAFCPACMKLFYRAESSCGSICTFMPAAASVLVLFY